MAIISFLLLCFAVEIVDTVKSCNDTRGHHPSGSTWSPVPCLTCHCHEGIKACALVECPRLSCARTGVPNGECCPVCLDQMPCKFEGKSYAPEEHWQYAIGEPCVTCHCVQGETNCGIKTCPVPLCNSPVIPRGECCPQCVDQYSCVFRGSIHGNGHSWQAGDCLYCRCSDGTVACFIPNCPDISRTCLYPTVLPDQCCPICPTTISGGRLQVTLKQFNVREERKTLVKFEVDLSFENDDQLSRGINITGNNIWRISAWFSHAPPRDVTDESNRRLFNEQVLTDEQSSVAVTNGRLGDMGTINYRINVTRLSCAQIMYMCVSFDTVDKPQIVSNQAFLLNSILNDNRRLTVCRVNWYCKRKLGGIKRRNLRKIQRRQRL